MKISEAFLVADRVVCHTCQTVRPHSVNLHHVTMLIYFKCRVCGDECDETLVTIAKEKTNE